MAISLKNVDDRLKVLENKLTGSVIGFPDWSKMKIIKAQNSGTDFSYTAKTSIWLLIWMGYPNRSSLYVNDKIIGRVASAGGKWEDHNTVLLPLNSNVKVKVTSCYYGLVYEIPIKL